MTTPLVYTIPETAKPLKVSEVTVKRMLARGQLPAVRIGTCVRIPHHEIVAFIEEHASRPYAPVAPSQDSV